MATPYAVELALRRRIPFGLLRADRQAILALDLRDWTSDRPLDPETRWAFPSDLDALRARGLSRAGLLARFDAGARVSVLQRAGQVIAWIWDQRGAHESPDFLRFSLSPDELWWFDGWVAPEHRGRRALNRLMHFHVREAARAGYGRILLAVDVLNRSSLRATTAFGFERVGSLSRAGVLGVSLLRAGGSTRIGRWSSARRLTLSSECLAPR